MHTFGNGPEDEVVPIAQRDLYGRCKNTLRRRLASAYRCSCGPPVDDDVLELFEQLYIVTTKGTVSKIQG
jgi:hypothetical protein